MPFKKICGVYVMIDQSTGKHYIGAARHCYTRWAVHRSELRKGKHIYQSDFERALKEGALTFSFLQQEPLSISNEKLLALEQLWANRFPDRINKFKNVTGKGRVGRKHSEESRRKMSLSRKGRKTSLATRKKISQSNKGRKQTPEHVENNRRAHLGIKLGPFTKEHREKIRQALLGRKFSPQHVENWKRSRWPDKITP